MHPELSAGQRELKAAAESFLRPRVEDARFPFRKPQSPGSSYWLEAAGHGWFSSLGPSRSGRLADDGLLRGALIAEARGRFLEGGPFITTNVAVHLLSRFGSAAQKRDVVPALMAGRSLCAMAFATAGGDWSGTAGVLLERRKRRFRLNGSKGYVDSSMADWLLVFVGPAEAASLLLIPISTPGITTRPMTSADADRAWQEVDFGGVEVGPEALVGRAGAAAAAISAGVYVASVLAAAETVGAMSVMVDLGSRVGSQGGPGQQPGPDGPPRGDLADASLTVELAQACVAEAAGDVESDEAQAMLAISLTLTLVADAANEVADRAVRLRALMAPGSERDRFDNYVRRLSADTKLLATQGWHRKRLAQFVTGN